MQLRPRGHLCSGRRPCGEQEMQGCCRHADSLGLSALAVHSDYVSLECAMPGVRNIGYNGELDIQLNDPLSASEWPCWCDRCCICTRLPKDAVEALQRLRVENASYRLDPMEIAGTCTVPHGDVLLLEPRNNPRPSS